MCAILAKRSLVAAGRRGICAIAAAFALAGCGSSDDSVPLDARPAAVEAEFVGSEACVDCHRDEAESWTGSHHDLAMQVADESTVLGNFDGAALRYGDVTTRFYRRDGSYLVSTDGADGEMAEFRVAYTFGAAPLQQYLIAFDDGSIQALSIAWDARPAEAGGQRWLHLYSGEIVDHADPLHWTGLFQRWNTQCADCHSTGLDKQYDPEANRFATQWAGIDVGCEACHGPGSIHVANPAMPPPASRGVDRAWVFEPGESIALRVPDAAQQPGADGEIEVCAPCHSRRAQLTDSNRPGDPFLDGFRPELLADGLYHADGQILDEVYVYGSFLQSAMARAGVVCSDCHEPHSAALRADGNAVCGQCHLASVYDQPAHHRHEAGTAASECVACHMRSETYMVVDPRRDHSFRVPRPDLSSALDSPNACNDCHRDESAEWAAARVAEWYPDGRSSQPHYGQAIRAGRSWAADARPRLVDLIDDEAQPGIVRATGVRLLARQLAPADVDVLGRTLDRGDTLMQLAAIEAAAELEPAQRVELTQRFLTHDRLALRIAAARILVGARSELSTQRQADLDTAIAEYLGVQTFNSDRPEGLLSAANVATERGEFAEAEALYRRAIGRYPFASAPYVNLADLYRLTGRSGESEATLREGLGQAPDAPGIHLSLAFALVRRGATDEAMAYFRSAADLAPDEPYYVYVLAIARNDAGEPEQALELLEATHERFPRHAGTLFALATMLRDAGEPGRALQYAERLAAQLPGDANALALLRALEQQL